jgi:signal transduction histidine kinase/CheY-like chemotaxis protein
VLRLAGQPSLAPIHSKLRLAGILRSPTLSLLASSTRSAIVAARAASLACVFAGTAVLLAWLIDLPGLKSLYLPGPTLKTNAALCLTCGGLANLLLIDGAGRRRRRVAGYVLASVPAVVGFATLLEHLSGWNLGIDQLIAVETAGALATMSPNRMGPPASSANLLLGSALFLRDSRSRHYRGLGHLFAFAACVLVVLPLMGFAYGFSGLYSIARYTGISLINALCLLSLALAIQAGRPDSGLMALLCRGDEAGVFARRLLPAAILLPFGIGWLLSRLLGAGVVDAPFAISAMALALMIVMGAATWRTGTHLVSSLDAREATEQALAERERTLRLSDHQKTEFIATLSHELRNPLAPIRFAVELLNGPPSSAERARRTIERQVQHLARLIDDLLDLTRINRNKLELHIRPAEVRQLVNDAVDAVSNEVNSAKHRVDIDVPQQPVWLLADPDRVVQMLVNLLTNATRYSDPGGTIRIESTVRNADVTISVRDTGHGIDPADLERVFDRFVQVGSARHGGLGIGLALVKALAEMHGGDVEARSAGPGQGSEFRLRLPRSTPPVQAPAITPAAPVAPRRILVVDDNRDAADLLGRLMRLNGHDVLIAYSGEDALHGALDFKPEIGLLDIGMPQMDGYELAARLRSEPGLQNLFLVAITGWGQEEDRRRTLSAGFDAHLTKPASREAIMALLADRFQSVEEDATPG